MSFVSRQLVQNIALCSRGTGRDGGPVHSVHLLCAGESSSGRIIVVINHTLDILHPVIIILDMSCSTGVVDVTLTLSWTMLTGELEFISACVCLQ